MKCIVFIFTIILTIIILLGEDGNKGNGGGYLLLIIIYSSIGIFLYNDIKDKIVKKEIRAQNFRSNLNSINKKIDKLIDSLDKRDYEKILLKINDDEVLKTIDSLKIKRREICSEIKSYNCECFFIDKEIAYGHKKFDYHQYDRAI